jgi:hypothetical protein
VREAQQRIDSREYAEWLAYYRLEPFGEGRADWRVAIAGAAAANATGNLKRPLRPSELLAVREPQSEADMQAKIRLAANLAKKRHGD